MSEVMKNKRTNALSACGHAAEKMREVLQDTSGANKTTEVLLGVVAAVVIGMLIINSATGFISSTFWPMITSKITGIFS